ncbi:MAG: glycosyltransferase [Candidatus Riflebacteria bacterium]|nr:glycosyltransferase [Candidatus Riflebacteria bacterium]
MGDRRPRVLFVTNLATHYRAPLFERLADRLDAEFLLFSDGKEWFWSGQRPPVPPGLRVAQLPGFWVGRAARVTPGLPWELCRRRHVDVVVKCMNGRFALPATYLTCLALRLPFVLWTGMWLHPTTLFHRLSRPLVRWIYRRADAVVTYGPHVSAFVKAEGCPGENIFVSPQSVDNDLYGTPPTRAALHALAQELGVAGKRVLLAVGRFVPEKGLLGLLDAFSRVGRSDAALVLIGQGPLRQQIEERVAARRIEGVTLVAPVPAESVRTYYYLAHALVLPSVTTDRVREPWGLVVNEAMNAGVPVVATDAVGAAAGGLVVDRVTGLVVPERDEERMAAALRSILDDPAGAAAMGEAARRRVRAYTFDAAADGFVAAIHHALSRRRGARPS